MVNHSYLLHLYFIFTLLFECFGNETSQECFVHEVHSNITFEPIQKNTFTIGYFKLNNELNFSNFQIFIYILDDKGTKKNESTILQVYFTKNSSVVLFENDKKVSVSRLHLAKKHYPYFETFEVRIHGKEFQLLRPAEVFPIVKGIINMTTNDKWIKIRVQNPSSAAQYVTLNCLTGCRIFKDIKHPMKVDLPASYRITITINMLWHSGNGSAIEGASDGIFTFGLNFNSSQPFNKTLTVLPGDRSQIKIHVKSEKRLLKIIHDKQTILNKTLDSEWKNFTFILFRSEHLWWSFKCRWPSIDNSTRNESTSIVDYDDPDSSATSRRPNVPMTIGEVTAWVIASISLCGMIIIGLTLCSKVTHTESGMEYDVKGQFEVSASHIEAFEMIPYPKDKAIFYTKRRPDEGVEPANRTSSHITSEFLYPMPIDDGTSLQEDIFTSLRSCDTIVTKLSEGE